MNIEAGKFVPIPSGSFWIWEIINIIIPIIGVLFFNWDIFSVVYLFWMEVLLWGAIGVLKIITAGGISGGIVTQLISKIGHLVFYIILYLGLFTILFSFTFIELSSSTMLNGGDGIAIGLVFLLFNYLIGFFSTEIVTKRYLTRFPFEVIMERFMFALPLSLLILFGIVPLAKKFQGNDIEKAIAVGIIIVKFIMSIAIQYLPNIVEQKKSN